MSKKTMVCAVCLAAFMAAGVQAAPAAELAGAGLVPPPIGLPAPAGFMKILQMLTFYLHILMVNVVLGSVLPALLDRRAAATGGRGGIPFMPKALALAVNFASAPFPLVPAVY